MIAAPHDELTSRRVGADGQAAAVDRQRVGVVDADGVDGLPGGGDGAAAGDAATEIRDGAEGIWIGRGRAGVAVPLRCIAERSAAGGVPRVLQIASRRD